MDLDVSLAATSTQSDMVSSFMDERSHEEEEDDNRSKTEVRSNQQQQEPSNQGTPKNARLGFWRALFLAFFVWQTVLLCISIYFLADAANIQASIHLSPSVLALLCLVVSLLVAGVFYLYDVQVQRALQQQTATKAQATEQAEMTALLEEDEADAELETGSHFNDPEQARAPASSSFLQSLSSSSKKQQRDATTSTASSTRAMVLPAKTQIKSFLKNPLLHQQKQTQQQTITKKHMGGSSKKNAATTTNNTSIADFFPHATVLQANIAGFGAWSSTRPPADVFFLLQEVQETLERLAKRRRVTTVESDGVFLAVTGVPDAQKDHALRMVQFAQAFIKAFLQVVKRHEMTLGPDTGDLRLCVGVHSGPVTAGILQGDIMIRPRFQLLHADTINVCRLLVQTCDPHRIQVSQATAELVLDANQGIWLQPRHDLVTLNSQPQAGTAIPKDVTTNDNTCGCSTTGKRLTMQTYWLGHRPMDDMSAGGSSMGASFSSRHADDGWGQLGEEEGMNNSNDNIMGVTSYSRFKKQRKHIDWMVDLMAQRLRALMAQRDANRAMDLMEESKRNHAHNPQQPSSVRRRRSSAASTASSMPEIEEENPELDQLLDNHQDAIENKGETLLDELVECFTPPRTGNSSERRRSSSTTKIMEADPDSIQLPKAVMQQLRSLVSKIASRYNDNAFHNFQHACHVSLSVNKILNRVVRPTPPSENNIPVFASSEFSVEELHNFTYDIASDKQAHLAIVFCALIHDVDHMGVSNVRLAEENPELGEKYKNRSIAEQNSVDIAWELLMDPEYRDLQKCMFTNAFELNRFRQIVANVVLATDIFEKQAKEMRNQRWENAFREKTFEEDGHAFREQSKNAKATIVIEHIIQASDVSHCMQHWSVYTKWNEFLFREMFEAFDQGRSANDPTKGWYKGELWFFDNYIIPLAKKLDECKVFGVASDEFLNFAQSNRRDWEVKGEQMVQDMAERYRKRKEMEIGGLTNDEINSFSAKDLELIMKKLIKRGHSNVNASVDPTKSRNASTQAWMDALEVYERAPAAPEIRDRSIVFPVYSGVFVWLKGCNVTNDKDGYFLQNLARKYTRESKLFYRQNPIHYFRALPMLAEVTAEIQQYETALALVETLKKTSGGQYSIARHSLELEKTYGVDRSAVAFSNAAMWHEQLGQTEQALAAVDYVLDEILPRMDPTNTLGMFELLTPLFRVLKPHGQNQRCFDLFNHHVRTALFRNHGPDAFTPTKSIHDVMAWMFGMAADADNDGFEEFEDALAYLTKDADSGIVFPFLDTIVAKTTVSPSDMTAELCLLLVKRLERQSNDDNDTMETRKMLVIKSLRLVRLADKIIKERETGKVLWHIANVYHDPLLQESVEMAKKYGVYTDEGQKDEGDSSAAGLAISLPPSYLVKPVDAKDFLPSS